MDVCFACGRALGRHPKRVDTRDAQTVFVGRECYRLIAASGPAGYQPPRGGPRLYLLPDGGCTDSPACAGRGCADCQRSYGPRR
jgi:hypothetical protein